MKTTTIVWITVGVLLIALVAGGLWSSSEPLPTTRVAEVEGCKLDQQACETTLASGVALHFEMGPYPLSTTEPLALTATFSQPGVERVEVLFEGRDMYMGLLHYRLKPEADGRTFRGKGSLSICVRRLMEWLAVVRVLQNGEWVEIPFAFETLHE